MRDEALDLVTMVLALAVTVGICLNLVTPLVKKAQEVSTEQIYNKTTQVKESTQDNAYLPYTLSTSATTDKDEFNGAFTYQEIILMLCNQNYFMPNPRVLDIGGKTFNIQSGEVGVADPTTGGTVAADSEYTPKSSGTYSEIKQAVDTWCALYGSRDYYFKMILNVGDEEGTSDDVFALHVLGYKIDDPTNKPYYFRCTEGGLSGYNSSIYKLAINNN